MQQAADAFHVAADAAMLQPFPVIWITAEAGCRCILCCCRCILAASLPRDLDHRKFTAAADCRYTLCCCRCILAASLPRYLDPSCSRLQMHFCCCRCILTASFPRDLDPSCSRLQMHFMLLQMHPRCISSP
jgi:hypothetical protein